MADTLTLKVLQDAVGGTAAAFRSRITLQPAGGEGTKVFPPTYAGAVYATEKRRIRRQESETETEVVECVLLDSVQSQANRMEEALQQAIDSGRFQHADVAMPLIEVDFTRFWDPAKKDTGINDDVRLLDPVGKVSSLQTPHRIADAILRDSMLNGQSFRQSDLGKRIGMVSARDATALFELCPTALIFGMWDSTGPKGGLGAKFERAMVSEIVGINAVYGVKTSSRIDPLGIQLKAGPLYASANGDGVGWTLDEASAKREKNIAVMLGKDGRPSEANHGNVTPSFGKYTKGAEGRNPLTGPDIDVKYSGRRDNEAFELSANVRERENEAREGRIAPGGVTIDRAEQTVVLSLPALRRLRFPINGALDKDPKQQAEIDNAARTVLAALGLCAAALAAENGLDLRSRCLLWPTDPLVWELLGRPGEAPTKLGLNADAAIDILKNAVKQAKKVGLPWRDDPLVLTPSDELVKLVVKSQQLAIQQGGESGEGGE